MVNPSWFFITQGKIGGRQGESQWTGYNTVRGSQRKMKSHTLSAPSYPHTPVLLKGIGALYHPFTRYLYTVTRN